MGDVIELQDWQLVENHELVVDLCRYRENLLTEKFIRKKYRLSNTTWDRLGSDEGNALVEKVEEEALRRIRDGSAKREKAQLHVTAAPDVLKDILLDTGQSARHRIDSAKTLDAFAANGPGSAAAGTIFEIRIDLGGGVVEHYRKPVKIDANYTDADINIEPAPAAIASDTDADDVDSRPQLVAATTTPTAATSKALEDALASLMQFGD